MLVRSELPDTAPHQSYSINLIASNSDGNATIPITAVMPAAKRTARYPATNASLPLDAQSARQTGVWFTERYPPQGFSLQSGQYLGKSEVRKTSTPNKLPSIGMISSVNVYLMHSDTLDLTLNTFFSFSV